jgi:hypothetical protein
MPPPGSKNSLGAVSGCRASDIIVYTPYLFLLELYFMGEITRCKVL